MIMKLMIIIVVHLRGQSQDTNAWDQPPPRRPELIVYVHGYGYGCMHE